MRADRRIRSPHGLRSYTCSTAENTLAVQNYKIGRRNNKRPRSSMAPST